MIPDAAECPATGFQIPGSWRELYQESEGHPHGRPFSYYGVWRDADRTASATSDYFPYTALAMSTGSSPAMPSGVVLVITTIDSLEALSMKKLVP